MNRNSPNIQHAAAAQFGKAILYSNNQLKHFVGVLLLPIASLTSCLDGWTVWLVIYQFNLTAFSRFCIPVALHSTQLCRNYSRFNPFCSITPSLEQSHCVQETALYSNLLCQVSTEVTHDCVALFLTCGHVTPDILQIDQ